MTYWRLFVAALVLVSTAPSVATQSGACEPDGKIRFICGVPSPEDLIPVPGGQWVVASGYIGGGVHLINTSTFATTQVFPTASPRERLDRTTYAGCPGPVDPAEKGKLSAHGLAIVPGAK